MGSGLGFSLVVANMQKNTVNYDEIASWESLLGCLGRCCWIISEVCWADMGSGLEFSLVVWGFRGSYWAISNPCWAYIAPLCSHDGPLGERVIRGGSFWGV